MRLQRIKDRATNEGLQAGLGGQNLGGYRDDWMANLPPDTSWRKPPAINIFPFDARVPQSAGQLITRTEYLNVRPNHKYDLAGDSAAS
jgi:hypothetical protein